MEPKQTRILKLLVFILSIQGGSSFDFLGPIYSVNGRFLHFPMKKQCSYKTFGLGTAEIPVCQTTIQLGYDQPPLKWYRLGKMSPETTYTLQKVFKGLLQPEIHLSEGRYPMHDYDICCPTEKRIEKAPDSQADQLGTMQYLIHIPSEGMYQYQHTGTCLEDNSLNTCSGTCIQSTSTVYLAVFNFESDFGFSFAPFSVPSYCSCQNIGYNMPRYELSHIDSTL